MKVKELIDLLKELDQERIIYTNDSEYDTSDITAIDEDTETIIVGGTMGNPITGPYETKEQDIYVIR